MDDVNAGRFERCMGSFANSDGDACEAIIAQVEAQLGTFDARPPDAGGIALRKAADLARWVMAFGMHLPWTQEGEAREGLKAERWWDRCTALVEVNGEPKGLVALGPLKHQSAVVLFALDPSLRTPERAQAVLGAALAWFAPAIQPKWAVFDDPYLPAFQAFGYLPWATRQKQATAALAAPVAGVPLEPVRRTEVAGFMDELKLSLDCPLSDVLEEASFSVHGDRGLVGLIITSRGPRGEGATIEQVWAHPSSRGKGVASALMLAAINGVAGLGLKEVEAWELITNKGVQQLNARYRGRRIEPLRHVGWKLLGGA